MKKRINIFTPINQRGKIIRKTNLLMFLFMLSIILGVKTFFKQPMYPLKL